MPPKPTIDNSCPVLPSTLRSMLLSLWHPSNAAAGVQFAAFARTPPPRRADYTAAMGRKGGSPHPIIGRPRLRAVCAVTRLPGRMLMEFIENRVFEAAPGVFVRNAVDHCAWVD